MNLYLATSNNHKAEELRRLLAGGGSEKIAVRNAFAAGGMPPVEETAGSFEGNARLKARSLKEKAAAAEGWVLADDSGLEVDALCGAPGVYSSRYAGEDATDAENNAKLLRELEGVPAARRTARFRCCLVLIAPDGTEEVFEGVCEGRIAFEPSGTAGFGYDPLFIPAGLDRTFAGMGEGEKNRVSHRGRALERLVVRLAGSE